MTFARQAVGSAAVLALGIVASIVLARILGAEARGEYGLAVRVAGLVLAVAQWGIPEVLLQAWSEARTPEARSHLAGSALFVGMGSAVAVAAVVGVLSPLAGDTVLRGVDPVLLAVALGGSVVSIGGLLARRFLQLDGRLDLYNAMDVVRTLFFLGLAALLVAVSAPRLHAGGAMAAWLAGEAVVALWAGWWLWTRIRPRGARDGSVSRSLLAAGLPVQVGVLGTFLGNEVGAYVLNASLGLAAVGVYLVALSIARLPLQVSMALRTVLQPRLVLATTDPADLSARVTRHAVVWMLALSLGLVVASPLVPVVFGAAFVESGAILAALLPGILAYGVMQLLAGYLLRVGKRSVLAVSSWTLAVAAVGLQTMGAAMYGLGGAALGLSVAYALAMAIVVAAFARASGLSPRRLLPGREELQVYLGLARTVSTRSRPVHSPAAARPGDLR